MGDRTDLVVDVLGTAVALRAPAPLLAELRVLLIDLEPGTDPSRQLVVEEEHDGRFRLLDTGTVVRSGIAPAVAAATVVWRLNTIAAAATRHLVIHAGCVAAEGAVLLPGRSGTGKSTLVAACVAAGMAYLSDEYAVVDLRHGTVVPYAKPLGLDGEHLVASSHLRAGSVGALHPPAGIVFPRYASGSRTSVTALDPGWTLLALAAHTTNLATLGGPALAWLAGLAAACPAWQVTYGDAGDAVPTVWEGADALTVGARPAEAIEAVTPTTTTVVLGDGLAVLDEPTGQVHLLNASASFVWRCVPEAPDLSSLVGVALDRAPAGALDRASITATVEHLARSGLLPAGPS